MKITKKFIAGTLCTVAGAGLIGLGLSMSGVLDKIDKIHDDATTEDKLPDSQLAIKINAFIEFDNGSSSGKANIQNKKNNVYPLYVSINLEDGTEVYKSSVLQPGEEIKNIKLGKKLKAGTYKAIAYFNALDEDSNIVGQAGAEIRIKVNN